MDFLPRPELLNDWLIARWTLLRLDQLREVQPQKAAALEALFDQETLGALLAENHHDQNLLLGRVLSKETLAAVEDHLFDLVEAAPHELSWLLAERLAALSPKHLEETLQDWLAEHALDQEMLALTSLAAALLAFPPGYGSGLADRLAQFVLHHPDVHLTDLLRPELLELGLRHDRPWVSQLIEGLFVPHHINRYLHTDALLHSYESLTGGLPYYAWLLQRSQNQSQQPLASLAPLFRPDAPLAQLESLTTQQPATVLSSLESLLPAEATRAQEFLKHCRSVSDARSQEAARTFSIALALAAWSLPHPDWSAMSARAIAQLGAADLERLPDADGALQRLRELPRPEVIEALEATLLENEESRGAATLATWMGLLGDPQFIRPLRASLDSSLNLKLADAAAEALGRYGDALEEALLPRWDDLTEAQLDYAAGLLALHGGEATIQHLVRRKADLKSDELREPWLRMALGLPDQRLLDILTDTLNEEGDQEEEAFLQDEEADLDEHFDENDLDEDDLDEDDFGDEDSEDDDFDESLEDDPSLDGPDPLEEAYLMQRLLLGKSGEDLWDLRTSIEEALGYSHGDVWQTDPDEEAESIPLIVSLRCEACGAVADYTDPIVYVDFQQPANPPVIEGQLPCSACARKEVLQWTDQGLQSVLMRCEAIQSQHLATGSLDEMKIQLMDGQNVCVGTALQIYGSAVQKNPESTIDLFMLARCSYTAGYHQRGTELLRRCLATQPAYIQAALDLANILQARHTEADSREALDLLQASLAHKQRWQLFRSVDHPSEGSLKRHFVDLYNRLREALQDDSRPRLKTADLETAKASRNDPCPCGSGQKYKKCCLQKNQ